MSSRDRALEYHRSGRPGKIEVVATKSVSTQADLSLAYSPGVAEPCREIQRDPELVDVYTARRNLVAVVTNGTAVLGLGDIGPRAAKPVMEGKGVLFKRFADIDVFDLEIDEKDPERFVDIVASLEPTFGGINLEDVRAPDCFFIEKSLRERMNIPVFHDDQHGTAIISTAALLNAADIQGKTLDSLKIVCIGAGAAAVSCMSLWVKVGARPDQMSLYDKDGALTADRDGLDEFRAAFARPPGSIPPNFAEALDGADVLVGLSAGGIVSGDMIRGMAERPIIFALANPDPEISYEEACRARPDAIVATGRSDHPNQVNNVLGFPYIFRGALDVRARGVDDSMKLAAARAIADLAREEVPDEVLRVYGLDRLAFGPKYIIPKPFDSRVLYEVAPAVARAAIDAGLARETIDIPQYRERLYRQISPTRRVLHAIAEEARAGQRRIVFPEANEDNILRAAARCEEEGIAKPILVGDSDAIAARAREIGVSLSTIDVVDPRRSGKLPAFVEALWVHRRRKGMTRRDAEQMLDASTTAFGLMMVDQGDADGLVAGYAQDYPATIRPTLQIIGVRPNVRRAAGMYMIVTRRSVRFLADTTINIDPDAEALAEIAVLASDAVRELGIEPQVAMLSFSNFGDAPHPRSIKVREAVRLVKERQPDLAIDGEMQANVAVDEDDRSPYPFCELRGPANVLIFPNLDAGNASYKLLAASEGAQAIGPIVLGVRKPVNVLQQGASVEAIVHVTSITAASAARRGRAG